MIKRLFDVAVSFVLIIILIPLFIFIIVLNLYLHGFPIFFIQNRIGFKERSFKMIKFRTMTSPCDGINSDLSDFQRISKFGYFLRSTSLDELPELFNVIRGDMSLVGPRPLLCQYLPLYSKEQTRRHNCLPGMTGWAQINGRNTLSWEEKFKYDVWYADNQSFWLDIKIILITLKKIIRQDGILTTNNTIMPPFDGKN